MFVAGPHLGAEGWTAVYAMCVGDMPTKIGISANPGSRCREIQTGQHRIVRIFWAVRLSRKNALAVERATHKALKKIHTHVRGEWFNTPGDEAVDMIERQIRLLDIPWRSDPEFGYERGLRKQ